MTTIMVMMMVMNLINNGFAKGSIINGDDGGEDMIRLPLLMRGKIGSLHRFA